MDPTRDNQSQSSNEAPTQSLRRSRRLNRSNAVQEVAPSRHHSTWVSQNRQMERQRSFYSNYYSNSRNRNATQANSDSQPNLAPPPPEIPGLPHRRPRSGSLGAPESRPEAIARISLMAAEIRNQPSTLERTLDSTEIGEAEPLFNTPATQTSNATPSTSARTDPRVAPRNSEASTSSSIIRPLTPIRVSQFPLSPHSPFHEYLQHLGAFISRNTPAILVSDLSGNGREATDQPEMDPLNFDAMFLGLGDGPFFNNGLSKQEINRHTISYEYKASAPLKRKRMKTEDGEAAAPSAQTSSATNDGCSICLDKLNPNVIVRRLPCLHVFHIKCIDKWLKQNKKCPICRIAININYDTLMSSLESGSSIDQCLSQQESSSRFLFRPTITLQVQSNGGIASLSSFTFASPSSSSRSTSSGSNNNNNN